MQNSKSPLSTMSNEEVLLRLLKKERGYYKVLLDLTRQEGEALCDARPLSEIVAFTKKRKIIFTCIEEIEQAIAPLKKYWKDSSSRSGSHAEDLPKLIEGLDLIIREILEIDRMNQAMMQKRLQKLRHTQPRKV